MTSRRIAAALAAAALGALVSSASAPATASSLIETRQCPDGYTGVVVTVDGHDVMACQNMASVRDCPPGSTGVIVMVGSQGVIVCASKMNL